MAVTDTCTLRQGTEETSYVWRKGLCERLQEDRERRRRRRRAVLCWLLVLLRNKVQFYEANAEELKCVAVNLRKAEKELFEVRELLSDVEGDVVHNWLNIRTRSA